MSIRSQKIRRSAKSEECSMNSPLCNHNPETTVWCHSNFQEHGKGVGHKADDHEGFYGCSGCSQWFDFESKRLGVSRDERLLMYYRAHSRSLRRLIDKGIVVIV